MHFICIINKFFTTSQNYFTYKIAYFDIEGQKGRPLAGWHFSQYSLLARARTHGLVCIY